MSVKVIGGKRLERKFEKLAKALGDEHVEPILIEAARPIQKSAIAKAEWEHVKDAIVLKKFKRSRPGRPGVFVAIDFRKAPDAYWLEFGTAARFTSGGRYTGKLGPHPFFRPAIKEQKGRAKRIIKAGMKRRVDNAVR